jgi:hypothetical protein
MLIAGSAPLGNLVNPITRWRGRGCGDVPCCRYLTEVQQGFPFATVGRALTTRGRPSRASWLHGFRANVPLRATGGYMPMASLLRGGVEIGGVSAIANTVASPVPRETDGGTPPRVGRVRRWVMCAETRPRVPAGLLEGRTVRRPYRHRSRPPAADGTRHGPGGGPGRWPVYRTGTRNDLVAKGRWVRGNRGPGRSEEPVVRDPSYGPDHTDLITRIWSYGSDHTDLITRAGPPVPVG